MAHALKYQMRLMKYLIIAWPEDLVNLLVKLEVNTKVTGWKPLLGVAFFYAY